MEQSIVKSNYEKGTFGYFLESKKKEFARILPKYIDPERFIGVILLEIRKNPKLLECSKKSFLGALLMCAQTGLLPGPHGHAYLVPYKGEVQFQEGYRGLVHLLWKSGHISTIESEVIYQNDYYDTKNGRIEYRKKISGDRGKAIGVYAQATFKDGFSMYVIYSIDEINKVKAASPTGKKAGTPWFDWEDEMRKKTALRRLAKILPLDDDLKKKIAQDEAIKYVSEEQILKGEDVNILEAKDEMDWSPDTEKKTIAKNPPVQKEVIQNDDNSNPEDAEFKEPEKTEKPVLGEYAQKVWDIIMEKAGGDEVTAEDMLEAISEYENKDHVLIAGIRKPENLNESRAQVCYGKLRKNDVISKSEEKREKDQKGLFGEK
jgi:phage RecT family recombinase